MSDNAQAVFIDTNILVYLLSEDQTKASAAEAVVSAGGTISVQVLNELANVIRRKTRMTWQETHVFLDTLRSLMNVTSLTVDTHMSGLAIAERYGLSTYDAMIAAAAIEAGCTRLISEDMQDGMRINDCLTIRNPFLPG